jgi:hypothetical protein
MDFQIEGLCPDCKRDTTTIVSAADDGLEPIVLCAHHGDQRFPLDIRSMTKVAEPSTGISTTFSQRHPTRVSK